MPVVNMPLIGRTVAYLKGHGVGQIVVNAHHHHRQVTDWLDGGRPFGLDIDVRVELEILGTGGGIRNTLDFWDDEPFFVINGDILTDINLGRALEQHKRSDALVTLILHDLEPFNRIEVDGAGVIRDIAPKNLPGRLAFTGIHIMGLEVVSQIPEGQFSDIIDCYRRMILGGELVMSHVATGHHWQDIGTVKRYLEANRDLLGEESFAVGAGCRVDPSVKFEDWAVVGELASLEEGVEIRRSILWNRVRVNKGVRVIDSVVTSGRVVNDHLTGAVY